MVDGLLHRIVARPAIYDLVQILAGAGAVRRRLGGAVTDAVRTRGVAADRWVALDLGAGTGAVSEWLGPGVKYLGLDIDPEKLRGFAARVQGGAAVRADATCVPLADGAVDLVLCNSLTHHLTDAQLRRALAEAARVLKSDGTLVLTDAVWRPGRLPGRLLWRYDRGSFPRREEVLREAVAEHFEVGRWERFAVWHAYVIVVGKPRSLK
jgi:SAM-dependent methyltransferase